MMEIIAGALSVLAAVACVELFRRVSNDCMDDFYSTPWDEEWMLENGFSPAGINGYSILIPCERGHVVELFVSHEFSASLCQSESDHVLITGRQFKTRGDVAKLLEVLGASR